MVVIVLDYTTGEVDIHYNVPEGTEQEFVNNKYKQTSVSWMSTKIEKFKINEFHPVD